MADSLRQRCFTILADSVADVVGRRNLAYVAIMQASKTEDAAKDRWAHSMFGQISITSRKQIRTNAIEKAHLERARQQDAKRRAEPVIADLGQLFGRVQLA